jgi:6-pyruvoyl-tetrahydropterin synthase related domain
MGMNFTEAPATGVDLQTARIPAPVAGERARPQHFIPSSKIVRATMLAAATLVVAPYLLRGYTVGHDTGFHMSWWLEMSSLFRQGILHPRWAALAYYGYGEPAFLFYPPLSLYLGGVLTLLLPLRLALGVYVWAVALLAGFSFYYLCRHFFDRRAALAGAVVYVLNPYHLLEVHARCSLAELLVSVTLPLLLLAAYRVSEPGGCRIAAVAIIFAAISLTNVPLTVVSAYGASAFVLALILTRKSRIGLLTRFAVAIALGGGLAAFFLIPAWFEKPWVVASVHSVVPPAAHFVRLSALHDGHFGWALAGVEGAQIVLGCVALILCRRMKQRDVFWAFSALFAVSVVMVLPASAAIWRTAPALVYVQFPWRWLGPMGLALSFFIAAGVQHSRRAVLFAAGVCALGLVTLAAFTAMIDLKADGLMSSLKNSISAGRGYLAWPFVLPRNVKIDELGIPYYLKPGEPRVLAVGPEATDPSLPQHSVTPPAAPAGVPNIAITRWSAEARDFDVDTSQPTWIRARLFWYPGWFAYIDGNPINPVATDGRGAPLLRVPSGHSHVQLLYRGTRDQTVGMVISAVCLVLLLWMLRKQGVRRRDRNAVASRTA